MRRGETRRGTYSLAFCNGSAALLTAADAEDRRARAAGGGRGATVSRGGFRLHLSHRDCAAVQQELRQGADERAAEGRSCPVSASQSEE